MKILFLGGNMAETPVDWLVEASKIVVYKKDEVNINDVRESDIKGAIESSNERRMMSAEARGFGYRRGNERVPGVLMKEVLFKEFE